MYFVRHALSTGNTQKILQGHLDTKLSKQGLKQAGELTRKLESHYDIVYSSSLSRAKETAIIALNNKYDIIFKDKLREMNLGDLEGVQFSDMTGEQEMMWQKIHSDLEFNDHNGESPNEFLNRTVNIFNEIVTKAKQKSHQSILIFTHEGVLKMILEIHLKLTEGPFENTEIITIEYEYGKWKLMNAKYSN